LDLGKELKSAPSGASYEAGTIQFMTVEVEDKGHMYLIILSDGMITTSDKAIVGQSTVEKNVNHH
jgi:hypothetical protein